MLRRRPPPRTSRQPRPTTPQRPTPATRKPPIIGITGAIGAGKSEALRAFARHGAAVLDADRVVHELYLRGDVRDAVIARFGGEVLSADGRVDRRRVGERVFTNTGERRWLEALLHPLVREAVHAWIDEQRLRAPPPVALVQEVALLFETGSADQYDRTLVIRAGDDTRRRRLEARGPLTNLAAREARLVPAAEKARRADDVIDNDGDLDQLDRRVAAYLETLR